MLATKRSVEKKSLPGFEFSDSMSADVHCDDFGHFEIKFKGFLKPFFVISEPLYTGIYPSFKLLIQYLELFPVTIPRPHLALFFKVV